MWDLIDILTGVRVKLCECLIRISWRNDWLESWILKLLLPAICFKNLNQWAGRLVPINWGYIYIYQCLFNSRTKSPPLIKKRKAKRSILMFSQMTKLQNVLNLSSRMQYKSFKKWGDDGTSHLHLGVAVR